jgi:outer membrane receptor protein involved in Fe transport
MRTVLAGGVDVDWSPGSQVERQITPSKTTLEGGQKAYTSYVTGPLIYDYDVTYFAVSPYLSAEVSPLPRLRLSAGLRWDVSSFDYHDRLDTPETPRYRRPADTTLRYDRLTPKIGATYDVSERLAVFAAYRGAFRAPSQGQLFRQGSTADTVGLKPVKAANVELGLRAEPLRSLSLELSAYRLEKRDDILTYRDPVNGATQAVNAGRTLHQGIEAGLTAPLGASFSFMAAFSLAKHTYEEWEVDPARGIDYGGKEMESAPRRIGRAELAWEPSFLPRARAAVEWVHLGTYFMDAANTHRYEGHDLLNLRVSAPLPGQLVAFARVSNLLDARYAESSSYTIARGEELAPGTARSFFVGLSWDLRP